MTEETSQPPITSTAPGIRKLANGTFYDEVNRKFVKDPSKPTEPETAFESGAGGEKGKPGRPKLPRDANGNIIRDGSTASAKPDTLGDAPRKKKANAKPEYSADQKALFARQIVGVHAMFSVFTGFPELKISDREGEILSDALTAVAREYGVAVSGKAAAGMQFLAAAAMVYGPRALMISARIEAQKRAPKMPQGNATSAPKVSPIRPDLVPGTGDGVAVSPEAPPDVH